ncbi:MAG: BACON domain-containing protein, partial [Bifidobacteriaceae bacterium]|nr:BACON domain-containing protein [Bifidobacteriaceae bacterium]
WATLDKTSGQGTGTYSFKLSATTTPNTTGATRTATITIRYEGYWQEHQIVITQPPIKASTFSWTPGSGGGTYTLKGTPNAAWTAELSAPWVTASPSSGTGAATMLALTATPNTATSPRTATATVKAYGVPLWVVNITQGAASSTTASALSLTPGASGGTHTITGTPNAAWTASSSEPWVTTTPSTGTGAATAIKLTIAANTDAAARTATVTVKANSGATIWVVNVTQAGAQAEQEDVWTVGPYGWTSPATIPVTTTKAWTVTASAPWVAVSPGSGTGNASIKVNPAPNPSTAPRSATVTVKIAGVTTDVITINQSAAPPPVATTWTAGAAGWSSPGTLNWSTSLDWTAAASAEWVTVTPGSGKGNASIKVNVTKNTSKAARSATVTVKIGGAVAEVLTINQSG